MNETCQLCTFIAGINRENQGNNNPHGKSFIACIRLRRLLLGMTQSNERPSMCVYFGGCVYLHSNGYVLVRSRLKVTPYFVKADLVNKT